ncbi:MAG: hypothetical protein U0132_20710 [Gemmatimonadaceae bacterium]
MSYETHIVDNRTFLLGLDNLYRDAMKRHERGELLRCARHVAEELRIAPLDVPVEGYYSEDAQLTEYFRLYRGIQAAKARDIPAAALPEFDRLRAVASSPLYGRPEECGTLLPTGRDALSQALDDTKPVWNQSTLVQAAHDAACNWEDFSLVGLAARIKDVVVLTAVRESIVTYVLYMDTSALFPPQPQYVWEVDEELARQASRFVDTFNRLFGEHLPEPLPSRAKEYWKACRGNWIVGRCVRLGRNPDVVPTQHYHWAIRRKADGHLEVDEFWDADVWTTKRYRSVHQL